MCGKNTFWLTSVKPFPVVKGQQSALASHREASGKKSFLKASSHYIACLGPLAPQKEHNPREDVQAGQPSPPYTPPYAGDQLIAVRNSSCEYCSPGLVWGGRRCREDQ